MALRLVLDTNVWLDWLVFEDPGVLPLKLAVKTGAAVVCIDSACLDELARVLAYPLRKPPLDEARRSTCIAACRACSQFVETPATRPLPKCADPDDQKFIELAAGSGAGCLLSKDRALLAMRRSGALPFHIMTPAEFSARGGVKSFRQHH